MTLYTWDHISRFSTDPCGCSLCKKVQKYVIERTGNQLFGQIGEQYLKKHETPAHDTKVA